MIRAPNDFEKIQDEIGQTITIINITRPTDENGRLSGPVTTTSKNTVALVNEVKPQHYDLLEGGYYQVGDVLFNVDPDVTVNKLDKVTWDSKTYGVKEVENPQKIAGEYTYKIIHGVREE